GVISKNMEFVHNFVSTMPEKEVMEKTFVKLGISLEIRKEQEILGRSEEKVASGGMTSGAKQDAKHGYKIFYAETRPDKKITVADFAGSFRSRYSQIQRMLMGRGELANLVSINKISSDRAGFSIIGIVIEKRLSKNGNLIIKFEDLTGAINGVVKADRGEVFEKAKELQLDDVVGVKASGGREGLVFVHDIIYPDAHVAEKVKFDDDICVAFLSDFHTGSDRHLEQSVEKFLEWINSDHETARKVKYIFIVGDNVDGVGIYPAQEKLLKIKSMKGQYEKLAYYLRKIPKHITMFMCPGQHDAVRVAEPQPIIGKRYGAPLYEIENLVLVTNPTLVKLSEGSKEFKVLMYHGASIHTFINEIDELREMKAHHCPAKAVRHMLKRRHLSPTHSSVVYIPYIDYDPLVITEVPDILCTGEVHKMDVETYNGAIIITGSCWQAQTPFEEKVGNEPDPAKVPVFNLKTRELKVFDFGVEEEINRDYNAKPTAVEVKKEEVKAEIAGVPGAGK
ncbi:MAG: metallophosphoesterase, partial [Candidatus Nanoarchaeia archaeon]|nr:metallophosphoesterase [Candidatus Nanoarchaeia archaeon]